MSQIKTVCYDMLYNIHKHTTHKVVIDNLLCYNAQSQCHK